MAGQGGRAGLAPRRAAAALLQAVLDARQPLSEALEGKAAGLASLPPDERARAQRLAVATLRHLDRADALLGPFLRKPPPSEVRHLLRLAVVEHFEAGSAAHGVVNAAVDLAGRLRRGAAHRGLVNAVLRRALAQPPEVWAALPPHRLPDWLRAPLVAAWGAPAVAAMEAAHARGAPLDLTLRDPAQAAQWQAVLTAALSDGTAAVRRLPTGSLRLRGTVQVSALPGHDAGAWWVQDAAAALAARVLAPAAGARVLDLCAAPGGKTLQLASMGARVTALDISGPRLGRLAANLARTGLAAEVVTADALHWTPPAPFDAILLDAPCSASGTIRRHPDLPFVRDASGLQALLPLQAALIDRALGWLRPGGRLVYATCSLLPDEGEAQAAAALQRHPGLAVDDAAHRLPGLQACWHAPAGGLRLRPDLTGDAPPGAAVPASPPPDAPAGETGGDCGSDWAGGVDGFFIIALRSPGQGAFRR